jgi:hypothetical protein
MKKTDPKKKSEKYKTKGDRLIERKLDKTPFKKKKKNYTV